MFLHFLMTKTQLNIINLSFFSCHLVEYNSNDMDNLVKVIIPLFIDDGLIGCSLQIKGDSVKKIIQKNKF